MRRWLPGFCLLLLCLAGQVWAEGKVFHMGFYLPGIRDANLIDVRVTLQIWADEVGAGHGLKARAFMYQNMSELHRDALQGKVDIVIAPGMEMAENFEPDELTEGYTGFRVNTPEGLALVVSKQGGLKQFSDLRGKRLSRLVDDRLSDVFLETLCLKETGVACTDLLQISQEKRDIQSIHKVFFGQADAALVRLSTLRTASELNPQISTHLQTMLTWKTTALNFGLMNARSTSAYREQILSTALQSAATPRGKQILEIFKTDYMEQVDKNDLQPFWRLRDEYRELAKTKHKRKK